MDIGLVRRVDIDSEMQSAYLDYAMSVIVARALPDARDGLKPVHRRILYAMHDMGLNPNSPFKKSARIVGEVLGKYHPHGDMAIYESMARMAQDYSMRALLVDGQGNFGSIDGDAPAAMRYTEARLTSLATHLLVDINKNTVDFTDNFDGTLTEPDILPAAFPNLLVNGATGIAVGMATSIPPHNLGEVIDALIFMLGNWDKQDDITVDELMRFIKGPDFPTGGVIIQNAEIDTLASAYATGRGGITVQASAHLEEMSRGRNRIIVTELPYMTNKASLIERIASLTREGRLEGIADLRDESDRQGMRIVIELNKNADPDEVLRDLYKNTQMRSTQSFIMLALVGGEPRLLGLKQTLRIYLEHRLTVIQRRSEYDLDRARNRAHVLEGLRIALKHLDEVIQIIRRATDAEAARDRLIKRFRLSLIQAQAILDMQLRRLAALERKKIEDEYKEVLALIKSLEALLRSPKKMRQATADELIAIKETYADSRRTRVVTLKKGKSELSVLTTTDLTPEQTVWVMVSPEGLISRSRDEHPPRLGGRDSVKILFATNSKNTLYLVSETGEAAAIPIHTLPQCEKPGEGTPCERLSPLKDGRNLVAAFTLAPMDAKLSKGYILTVTQGGMVKKTALSELPGPAAQTFTLAKVNSGDRLGWVHLTDGKVQLFLLTANGMAIYFSESEVRAMGLVAAGVMGIKLQATDRVIGSELLPANGEVFMIASDGTAKRVRAEQYPLQARYGQGVISWKLPRGVHAVGITAAKSTNRIIINLAELADKTLRIDQAPLQNRTARGKSVVDLKTSDRVTGLVVPRELAPQRRRTSASKVEEPATPKERNTRRKSAGKPS
jgi:DNA gyrase subunit A